MKARAQASVKGPLKKGPVLVVEDESLVAFDLADMLEDLGFDEVVICVSYGSAEKMLASRDFAIAIFDLNLDGKISTPLIERARICGVRVIVASGYEAQTVPLDDATIPRMTKPYDAKDLEAALSDGF